MIPQDGEKTESNNVEYAPAPLEQPQDLGESEEGSRGEDYARGVWGRKMEFLLSVIGYSVGVGNLWRFPYLVMQNGGGAFLIPFFFFLILCGVPLFYLELCLGQFSGTSCLYVWKFCPLFKGIGYMMMAVSFIYCWYYIMVLVWVLVYLVNSFLPQLPWSACGQAWNTDQCIEGLHSLGNCSKVNAACNASKAVYTADDMARTASKEFWHNYVLHRTDGLEDLGTIQWHLAVALVVAWLVIFLCLMKGIKSVGKVVYVTALLPYVLLTGPGLALVIYPEAFTKLPVPQLWAVLFFVMLLSLGIDSQFGVFETLSSGLMDTFPRLRKRKVLVTACLCVVLMLLDLPYTTGAGIYLYQLVDWYFAAFCVLIISFLECFLIAWVYGADRFSNDVKLMIGRTPPRFIRFCWCFITPAMLLTIFLIMCFQYEPPAYDNYEYPMFAKVCGNILAMVPVIPLPVVMIYQIWRTPGSLYERFVYLLKPSPDWGPHISGLKAEYLEMEDKAPPRGVLDAVRHNLLGSSDYS
ncbi:SC6A8-like protein [Mya arenaria]|uniref:Transporter n=1 Tax=Mya arenaria TaxID=6604 RepID=A0ABY7EN01_MYAAR|nr:SC6A8-like protein [Mya arenaria]